MTKTAAIIPARWGASRFPGKPLVAILGKPLIQHVWERCTECRRIDRIIIATDDMRIAQTAFDFGAEVAFTSPKHPSGTDRLAEVAGKLRSHPIIVNVQGDEPAIDPALIDRLAETVAGDRKVPIATAACAFPDKTAAADANRVKVVTDHSGNALYFSRALIPFDRDGTASVRPLLHLGIYAYRRAALLQFVRWKVSPLEKAEGLEQLRALENGMKIRVITTKRASPGVDTPADLAAAERALKVLRRPPQR